MIEARIEPDFDSWRIAARNLLSTGTAPQDVVWTDANSPALPLLTQSLALSKESASPPRPNVSREFIALAKCVAYHRDPLRWPLLYRLLFRLVYDQPRLLEIAVDEDVFQAREMEKSVRRDIHKMHAFVRFRKVQASAEQPDEYVAFHRPDHLIIPAAAPWFARRFPVMRWTIFTPDASASWSGSEILYGPGVPASAVSAEDELEELWRTYYASIFNPARVKLNAMKKEMPLRHWPTLPETRIIDQLLRDAPTRETEMIHHTAQGRQSAHGPETNAVKSAAAFVPATFELPVLREAAKACQGCDLYCHATQTVFGEGPTPAVAMLVGEQPGDQEDRAGRPFVGPAGQLLDQVLEQSGIDRSQCYVTNAVKHFKFEPRGKRRIHAKPGAREIHACAPWLEAEVAIVKPRILIALGATAAQAIMGPHFRVTQQHGKVIHAADRSTQFLATIHPSALLRIPDPALREQATEQFLDDLSVAAKFIASAG
jgi:DNA polymerase